MRLMVHRTPLPPDLVRAANVTPVRADLSDPATLPPVVAGADVVIHFAGVLFAPRPERFLRQTNTTWFSNLLTACLEAGVDRVILISFPHVEGPSSADSPATGRLDGSPISVHARTRLEEERRHGLRPWNRADVLRHDHVPGARVPRLEIAGHAQVDGNGGRGAGAPGARWRECGYGRSGSARFPASCPAARARALASWDCASASSPRIVARLACWTSSAGQRGRSSRARR